MSNEILYGAISYLGVVGRSVSYLGKQPCGL